MWQLVIHDWSKFLPWEFGPYREWFYGRDGGPWHPVLAAAKKATSTHQPPDRIALYEEAFRRHDAFMQAFLLHLHRNPHHHQYWRLPSHGEKPGQVFEMPETYVREMLADWDGAGRAYNGFADTPGWYAKQTDIELHPKTRQLVERLL